VYFHTTHKILLIRFRVRGSIWTAWDGPALGACLAWLALTWSFSEDRGDVRLSEPALGENPRSLRKNKKSQGGRSLPLLNSSLLRTSALVRFFPSENKRLHTRSTIFALRCDAIRDLAFSAPRASPFDRVQL
jgi:hypothetical protein